MTGRGVLTYTKIDTHIGKEKQPQDIRRLSQSSNLAPLNRDQKRYHLDDLSQYLI
jgi:hypothetical protein